MFRRNRARSRDDLPARAFGAVVASVEAAKKSLVGAVPSARAPGRPLGEALFEFEDGLRTARAGMQAWRHPEIDAQWTESGRGIDEALRRAEDLRVRAPDLGFEPMLAEIAELISPLDVFEAAARRFRALGSRLP